MTQQHKRRHECRRGSHEWPRHLEPTRGGALLAVLWLSAALSAIAFSVANTVRGETERTATKSEGVRAYYLAAGAVDRALLHMLWGGDYFKAGMSRMNFGFPSGAATVELIPESSKLNINRTPPEEMFRLLVNLGVEPGRAQEIAAAILDWRSYVPGGMSPFDHYYLSLVPSFRARHASFQEIEELLLVKGMTPEIFHGSFARDAQGRLVPQGGLKNCVTVFGMTTGSAGAVDVNTAEPAVLATIGISPGMVAALVERRHAMPFRNVDEIRAFTQAGGPGVQRLSIGDGAAWTLRATSRIRLPNGALSDLQRSVSALVKFHKPGHNPVFEILRWYDN